eukprot:Cvel_24703.t1-p1 / transcript=Cvel_24703.t1 / gene=Cvel_24703 / organism=Chromera_velia_CCMP2878 / gene_product=hypothetical protein / transcript_product=hypothetical protein / location=Cvel_scaffold2709:22330-25279(+) / protein_length=596 / sequence_SO=supercontig / SO=protein_coding / is_pseudo=false
MGPKKDAPHGCVAIKGIEAKTMGVFGLTDDADIIKWVRQYADAVAILGDSDEWCGGLTLTNRNKVGVNVKHYVVRTEVEVLEKVVEWVPHLSSEVSEQLRIFYRHVVDYVSLPDAEWMKRYLQRTDVLRMGKVRIMEIRELLSRREKERISGPQLKALNEQILCLQTLKEPSSLFLSRPVVFSSGGELHEGASTEMKVKTEEETEAIPDTSRQMSVPVSSEQCPASDERDRRSSSSSSSSGGVQVISGLNAARGADKLRILEIQKEENEVLSGIPRRDNFPEGSEGKEAYASELASWAEKKEVFDAGKADRDTLVATLYGHIDQLASDGFALNEQADKLCREIDVLSPPPQAKGVAEGTAEGRLPSVFHMTPLTGGGVYPAVSPPDPAMVSVGGGAFLLSASSRIREAEVGAAGLEASALYPADRDKTFIIKSHLALWNQHKGRGGREEGEVKWDDVWEAGGSKTAPAKVAWDQIQRSLQGKVQRLKSHLFPRNKEHVEQVYKILKQRLLKEPLWWQEVVWGEVPPLEYWIPEDQVSPLTEAVADTGKAPAPPPSLAKAVMDTRKAPPRAPPPSVAKAAMDTRKAPAPPPSLAKAA